MLDSPSQNCTKTHAQALLACPLVTGDLSFKRELQDLLPESSNSLALNLKLGF